jgi:hypothetical protein
MAARVSVEAKARSQAEESLATTRQDGLECRAMEVTCPAAEIVHPVLSPNESDVECRIAGRLQPTRGSTGKPAICCENYIDCKIWRRAAHNNWRNRTVKTEAAQFQRANHTLSDKGHEREHVRA